MRNIQLKSTNGPVLFEGQYPDFLKCLEDAIAQKAMLDTVDLRNRNLANANLDEARMRNADLSGCNLTGVNLSEADMQGSNFSNTALYNACLCESDLRDCNFEDAIFGGTDMAGARISGSRFSTLSTFHLDFLGVRDMEGCVFKNPCGASSTMSKPPVVIHGLMSSPIVLFDGHVKIGNLLRPHAEWFGMVAERYLKSRDLKLAGSQ